MASGAEFSGIAGLIYRGVLLPSAIGLTIGAGAAGLAHAIYSNR
jgi:hypothetical protein